MTEPTPEEKASHIIYGGSLWVRAQKGSHSVRNEIGRASCRERV